MSDKHKTAFGDMVSQCQKSLHNLTFIFDDEVLDTYKPSVSEAIDLIQTLTAKCEEQGREIERANDFNHVEWTRQNQGYYVKRFWKHVPFYKVPEDIVKALTTSSEQTKEEGELELELYFDDYETKPRVDVIPVASKEHAKEIITGHEKDPYYRHADLYEVIRTEVGFD